MIVESLQRLYRRYCVLQTWNIGVVTAGPMDLQKLVADGRLGTVTWCPRFSPLSSRADPFVWAADGHARVIYEEIDHWNARGHIRSLSLDGFSRPQRTRAEIVKPYHLSYPHTVALGKLWYCIPESARSGGLDLYAWNPERGSWEFQKRMIDGDRHSRRHIVQTRHDVVLVRRPARRRALRQVENLVVRLPLRRVATPFTRPGKSGHSKRAVRWSGISGRGMLLQTGTRLHGWIWPRRDNQPNRFVDTSGIQRKRP